jgi:hypothetical protein
LALASAEYNLRDLAGLADQFVKYRNISGTFAEHLQAIERRCTFQLLDDFVKRRSLAFFDCPTALVPTENSV